MKKINNGCKYGIQKSSMLIFINNWFNIYFKKGKNYFLTIRIKFIKMLYNMKLRRLPSHHGEVSVMDFLVAEQSCFEKSLKIHLTGMPFSIHIILKVVDQPNYFKISKHHIDHMD